MSAAAVGECVGCGADETLLYYGLLPPRCWESLVERADFRDVACLKALLAKLAGYAMIGASFGIKAPQIFKVAANKSTAGLSPVGFYCETLCYIITAMYNVLQGSPISTYGEVLTILIQNLILVVVIWIYMRPPPRAATVAAVLAAFAGSVWGSAALPPARRLWLPVSTMPINVISRVPQILANHRNKHTGQLAAATVFMGFAGSGVRILTIIEEVGWDRGLLLQYGLSFCLNTVIWVQMLWYWKNTTKVMAIENAKKAQ
ncbi:unnamed protein product [Phaeothamnion confervicola]